MKNKKDRSEEDAEVRSKQKERTIFFKDAVGLVDKVPESNREKTWSEIVDESRDKEKERKEKEKDKMTKHWSKKVIVKVRKSKDTQEDEVVDEKKKEEEVRRLVREEEERDELRLDPSSSLRRRLVLGGQ